MGTSPASAHAVRVPQVPSVIFASSGAPLESTQVPARPWPEMSGLIMFSPNAEVHARGNRHVLLVDGSSR